MRVKELHIKGFRNIEEMELSARPGINVIFGENAQGKTNTLEAIWLCSGLKSFRGAKDSETVGFGSDFAKIKMLFESSVRENTTELLITERRRAKLNGVELPSPTGLMGSFSTVVFAPSFLSIIKDGPGERRRFIDAAICQLKPAYAGLLSEYNRVLKQRNSVLKDVGYNSQLLPLLDTIDEKIAELGNRIRKERASYLDALRPFVTEMYKGLSSGREEISFKYTPKCKGDEAQMMEWLLRVSRREDIINKTTTLGPHRDDMDIFINGISARSYGSQGQQRSCALALKLGEAQVIDSITGEQPVILLDDVMSELDSLRQDYILNEIKNRQVFITCCEPSKVLNSFSGQTVHIEKGRISKCI